MSTISQMLPTFITSCCCRRPKHQKQVEEEPDEALQRIAQYHLLQREYSSPSQSKVQGQIDSSALSEQGNHIEPIVTPCLSKESISLLRERKDREELYSDLPITPSENQDTPSLDLAIADYPLSSSPQPLSREKSFVTLQQLTDLLLLNKNEIAVLEKLSSSFLVGFWPLFDHLFYDVWDSCGLLVKKFIKKQNYTMSPIQCKLNSRAMLGLFQTIFIMKIFFNWESHKPIANLIFQRHLEKDFEGVEQELGSSFKSFKILVEKGSCPVEFKHLETRFLLLIKFCCFLDTSKDDKYLSDYLTPDISNKGNKKISNHKFFSIYTPISKTMKSLYEHSCEFIWVSISGKGRPYWLSVFPKADNFSLEEMQKVVTDTGAVLNSMDIYIGSIISFLDTNPESKEEANVASLASAAVANAGTILMQLASLLQYNIAMKESAIEKANNQAKRPVSTIHFENSSSSSSTTTSGVVRKKTKKALKEELAAMQENGENRTDEKESPENKHSIEDKSSPKPNPLSLFHSGMKIAETLKALEKKGFDVKRRKGTSHVQLHNPGTGKQTTLSIHNKGDTIGPRTAISLNKKCANSQ